MWLADTSTTRVRTTVWAQLLICIGTMAWHNGMKAAMISIEVSALIRGWHICMSIARAAVIIRSLILAYLYGHSWRCLICRTWTTVWAALLGLVIAQPIRSLYFSEKWELEAASYYGLLLCFFLTLVLINLPQYIWCTLSILRSISPCSWVIITAKSR